LPDATLEYHLSNACTTIMSLNRTACSNDSIVRDRQKLCQAIVIMKHVAFWKRIMDNNAEDVSEIATSRHTILRLMLGTRQSTTTLPNASCLEVVHDAVCSDDSSEEDFDELGPTPTKDLVMLEPWGEYIYIYTWQPPPISTFLNWFGFTGGPCNGPTIWSALEITMISKICRPCDGPTIWPAPSSSKISKICGPCSGRNIWPTSSISEISKMCRPYMACIIDF
jgi:hypothetical protein